MESRRTNFEDGPVTSDLMQRYAEAGIQAALSPEVMQAIKTGAADMVRIAMEQQTLVPHNPLNTVHGDPSLADH